MATASVFNSQLGQQQFLQLLTAQLAHQNPMEPMEQTDMLSQLAQFSSLGGIESLNQNFSELFKLQSLTQGAGLVGKQVTYYSEVTRSEQTGVVQSASAVDGKLVLTINGERIGLYNISAVGIVDPAASR